MRGILKKQLIRPCRHNLINTKVVTKAKGGKGKARANFRITKVVVKEVQAANIVMLIQIMTNLKVHKEELQQVPRTKERERSLIRRKSNVTIAKNGDTMQMSAGSARGKNQEIVMMKHTLLVVMRIQTLILSF